MPPWFHRLRRLLGLPSDRIRGAIEKSGARCSLGFTSSGIDCLSNLGSSREAIQHIGISCPLGLFTSGLYCIKCR